MSETLPDQLQVNRVQYISKVQNLQAQHCIKELNKVVTILINMQLLVDLSIPERFREERPPLSDYPIKQVDISLFDTPDIKKLTKHYIDEIDQCIKEFDESQVQKREKKIRTLLIE